MFVSTKMRNNCSFVTHSVRLRPGEHFFEIKPFLYAFRWRSPAVAEVRRHFDDAQRRESVPAEMLDTTCTAVSHSSTIQWHTYRKFLRNYIFHLTRTARSYNLDIICTRSSTKAVCSFRNVRNLSRVSFIRSRPLYRITGNILKREFAGVRSHLRAAVKAAHRDVVRYPETYSLVLRLSDV